MAAKPLTVHGVDISHHQDGKLNYALAVENGLKWMYHKATEGNSFVDSNYVQRRAEAKRAGIPFGAYHFARAEKADAVEEARHFIRVAKPAVGDLRPALDIETTEGMTLAQIRTWSAAFIAEVVKLTGVAPVVYTPYDLGIAAKDCLIWRPRYNNSNTPPVLDWDIWQFSNGVFGIPRSMPGFGNVDLNVMRDGLRLAHMRIPKPAREVVRYRLMHASTQYSDKIDLRIADLRKIFARAQRRKVAWITGTEADTPEYARALRTVAREFGYRVAWVDENDVFIAVDAAIVTGGWKVTNHPVIGADEGVGRHGPRGVLVAEFDTENGHTSVLGSHYLVKGRPSAKSKDYRANLEHNQRLAAKIGEIARQQGKGDALVFYGGDQNIVDRTDDTFMGQPLTSSWDELQKWENTGHGNIDVIASYDADGRVKAAYCEVLDDTELALNHDHFLVESGFDVMLPRS